MFLNEKSSAFVLV